MRNDNFIGIKTQDVLANIIREFVGNPTALKVQLTQGMTSTLMIDRDEKDHGKLCGTQGVMFKSLEAVVSAIAYRQEVRIALLPMEKPLSNERQQPTPFFPVKNWRSEPIAALLKDLCALFLHREFKLKITENDQKHTTLIDVVIDPNEETLREEILGQSLRTIFHAIGKNKGREIYINYLREAGAPMTNEAMPVINRGRFSQ